MQRLQYHGDPECNRGASGAVIPGGFGWLAQTPGECGAYIDIGTSIGGSDTGNNAPHNCEGVLSGWIAKINAGKEVIVLLPVYDKTSGTGATGTFHIRGLAAFQILGWRFPGSSPNVFHNTGYSPPTLDCTGSCSGIIGKFVEFTTMDSAYPPGNGEDLGAHVIGLTR